MGVRLACGGGAPVGLRTGGGEQRAGSVNGPGGRGFSGAMCSGGVLLQKLGVQSSLICEGLPLDLEIGREEMPDGCSMPMANVGLGCGSSMLWVLHLSKRLLRWMPSEDGFPS